MGTYKDMKDVASATAENGHLMAVTLGDLREALGYNRLGVRVLAEIGHELKSAGLGYFPDWVLDNNEVPRYGDVLRVYTRSAPVGQLIESVTNPTDTGDERLRDAATSEASAAVDTLERIKRLVLDAG